MLFVLVGLLFLIVVVGIIAVKWAIFLASLFFLGMGCLCGYAYYFRTPAPGKVRSDYKQDLHQMICFFIVGVVCLFALGSCGFFQTWS